MRQLYAIHNGRKLDEFSGLFRRAKGQFADGGCTATTTAQSFKEGLIGSQADRRID